MRPSPLRHPVAVLRSIIGLGQKELAKIVDKSTATIQAIELRKLALSEELALKISLETGASARWLMDGDPNANPVLDNGGSGIHLGIFTKNDFEQRRADRLRNVDGGIRSIDPPWHDPARLFAIKEAAEAAGNDRMLQYRIAKFFEDLEKEFGASKKAYQEEAERIKVWNEFSTLFEDPASVPSLADYKELVPSFLEAYRKLAKVSFARAEKHNMQEPGLFPLLRWAAQALHVNKPSKPHPLLLKKSSGSKKRRS